MNKMYMNKSLYYIFGMIVLSSCAHKIYQKEKVEPSVNKSISDQIQNNTNIQNIINPYKKQLDDQMHKVLSYTPTELNKKGFNSPLANLIADLVLEESNLSYKKSNTRNIDICVLNHGGIRKNLNKGNITTGDIYELMPFENEAVVVTLSPQKVLEMVDYLSESSKGHPIAGIEFIPFNHESIKINGQPFNKNKNYTVVTNDYLQKGGDQMYFFNNPIQLESLNIKLRDMMLDYFEKNDTIQIHDTKRILK